MRYKLLGPSGLRVSELCLGTMTFGEEWGWGADRETCRQILETFAEAGGNFIDTANLYTNGSSERLVGEWVGPERDRWVIATKYSLNTGQGEINAGGNHRKNLVQAVNASLKRMNLDFIDLLWLHAWDDTTPVEEVMRALDDLVRQGKVLYIGVSDTPAWVVSQANTLAMLRGWTPFIGLQIEYSLKERTPERDLLPMAAAFGLGITAWSPLGGGVLTGKYNLPEAGAGDREESGRLARAGAAALPERELKIAEVILEVADILERSPAQVALNWIRQKNRSAIPIIGARKRSQIEDNLACLNFELSEEQLQKLDEISAISLGFPHDFLQSSMVQEFAFGGALSKIDRRR